MGAVAIFAGALVLLAIPFGWLWAFPQLDQPVVAYALVLVGCPATMVAWAIALHAVNERFIRFSLRRHQANDVLEAMMPIAALICLLVLIARG